jgi:hypothetical protein
MVAVVPAGGLSAGAGEAALCAGGEGATGEGALTFDRLDEGGDPADAVLVAGLDEVATNMGEELRRPEGGARDVGALLGGTRGEVLPPRPEVGPDVGLVTVVVDVPDTTCAYVPVGLRRPGVCGGDAVPTPSLKPYPGEVLLLPAAPGGRIREGEVLLPRPGTAGSTSSFMPAPGLVVTAATSLSSPYPSCSLIPGACCCCLR